VLDKIPPTAPPDLHLCVRSASLHGLPCPHVWPWQTWVETPSAGYLMRQHLASGLNDRLSTRPFLTHAQKVRCLRSHLWTPAHERRTTSSAWLSSKGEVGGACDVSRLLNSAPHTREPRPAPRPPRSGSVQLQAARVPERLPERVCTPIATSFWKARAAMARSRHEHRPTCMHRYLLHAVRGLKHRCAGMRTACCTPSVAWSTLLYGWTALQ